VTRGGKFWKLYKRPGHRVIINADGDLIVRPTFIEVRPADCEPVRPLCLVPQV